MFTVDIHYITYSGISESRHMSNDDKSYQEIKILESVIEMKE